MNTVFLDSDDEVMGGSASRIGSITVKKGVDDASRFVSGAIGKAKVHGGPGDVAIIACGLEVGQALLAQSQLEEEGIAAQVVDMHTLKPLDEEAVAQAARDCGAIVTAEEHLLDGFLGGFHGSCERRH